MSDVAQRRKSANRLSITMVGGNNPQEGTRVEISPDGRASMMSKAGASGLDGGKIINVTIDETSKWTQWILMKSQPKEAKNMKSWRGWLCRFLHKHEVEATLNGLLILDLVLLAIGMQVELAYFDSKIKAYPVAFAAGAHNLSHYGSHGLHTAETVLKWTSVSILSIFGVENLLLMIGSGWEYFHNPMHPFDLVIVGVSIYFEVAKESFATSVLMLSRMWRFVRFMHGFIEVSEEEDEEDKGGAEKGIDPDLEAARRSMEKEGNQKNPIQSQSQKVEDGGGSSIPSSSSSSTSVKKPNKSKPAPSVVAHLEGPDDDDDEEM